MATEMAISEGSKPEVGPEGASGAAAGSLGPVGAIVWVRRRNGSWWPGRILGAEELPASQLMPPKAGTPVKLLGREDASVEWYNLEKSIRVKPFRCGDFDGCIERAEASQGILIKRREKYARREDAILHALELERKLLQKHKKTENTADEISNITPNAVKIKLSGGCPLEDYTGNAEIVGCSKFSDNKSQFRRVPSSLGEDCYGDSSYVDKGRYGKPISREEDAHESIRRTRGLQDFGLRIAPAKKKHFQFVAWDSLQKPIDNHVGDPSCAGQGMGGHHYTGSSKTPLGVKRKMSGSIEESSAKRRDRRRPLVQVLESSAKLPSLQSYRPDHDFGSNPLQEDKDNMGAICRAKRSRCIYLPVDSNDPLDHAGHSFKQTSTVAKTRTDNGQRLRNCLMDEIMSSGFEEESDTWQRVESETDTEEQENLLRDTKILVAGSENSVRDSGFNSIAPHMHPYEHAAAAAAEVGMSKWHMKGKRNIRNFGKGPNNLVNGNSVDKCDASTETSFESKSASFNMRIIDPSSQSALKQGFYRKLDFNYACEEGDIIDENSSHTHATVYGSQRYGSTSKAAKGRAISIIDSDDDSNVISQAGWEVEGPSYVARRTYWKEPVCVDRTYTDHLTGVMDSRIVDIDLKVRASYQGEHVPLVSLMSKLNGKAIIGHPVQVEVLPDRSTDSLLFQDELKLGDSVAPSPVWKTARRTAIQRVPRSNPARSLLEGEGEDSDPLQFSGLESNPPLKKAHSGHFSRQARLVKRSMSHVHRSASGKFQRKPSKSVSFSGKKTRTLSSLSIEHKHRGEHGDSKLARIGDILGGLTKSEAAVPLVPLKVVFSRILEAVGRTATSSAHRALVTSSTARHPL